MQIFLSSCMSTGEWIIVKTHEEVMDEQCDNKTKSEILIKLGAPDRSTDDGNNGEILVFDNSYTKTYTSGSSNTSIYEIFGVPVASTKTSKTSIDGKIEKEILFYINENNECYHWKTKGYDFSNKEYIDVEENTKESAAIAILIIGAIAISIPILIYGVGAH